MYRPVYSNQSEKGRTLLLLVKRNKQFADLFRKIKDPVFILQSYALVNRVYAKYFGDDDFADRWVTVLTYLYDNGYFWFSEMTEKMGFEHKEAVSVLKRLGKRHLIDIDRTRNLPHYKLTADGRLFIANFQKEFAAAMLQIWQSKRKGKKKVKRV